MLSGESVQVSYAGTDLKFCDGSPATNGNGWYGPTTVDLEYTITWFDVDVELVYGTLVTTVTGYGTVITKVNGCKDFYKWKKYLDPCEGMVKPVKSGTPRCSYHFPTESGCRGFFKSHLMLYTEKE